MFVTELASPVIAAPQRIHPALAYPARALGGPHRIEWNANGSQLFYLIDFEGDSTYQLFGGADFIADDVTIFRVRGTTPADHGYMPGVE